MAGSIYLDVGVLVFFLAALMVVAYQRKEPKVDWRNVTRKHLPYANLSEQRMDRILDRDDFLGAVVDSEVNHYTERRMTDAAVRGKITRNELHAEITDDVKDRAGDVLLPAEERKVINAAYGKVLNKWDDVAKKRKDT